MNFVSILDIRSTDYIAVINNNIPGLTSKAMASAKGAVYVGDGKERGVKNETNIQSLDSSIFNKVLMRYTANTNLTEMVRIADHLGLVFLYDIPQEQKNNVFNFCFRHGLFEVWPVSETDKSCNLLIKVRKYNE